VGNITSFTPINYSSTTDVSFSALWTTLPPLVQGWLGSTTGIDSGFVITTSLVKPEKPGRAGSGDVLITSTPEPASLTLLGSGLPAIGGFLRRKLRVK
jgi:PEP-CTERM motif-containing protein